jgi:hypothetical protein
MHRRGHETLVDKLLKHSDPFGSFRTYWRTIMAKRGRKKRDRKHTKANHGKRPNCGSKAVK